ncbi:MAG: ECF transporter S component [Lactobacillales bacterium]|jgi:hypothetical protein|nr:ECF transporter S component [Lactobacillales bacterium]
MKTRTITYAAIATALVVVVQFAGKTLFAGNTIVTGSLVNAVLVAATLLFGLGVGASAALLSPIFATILGLNAMIPLVPFIMVGNFVLILLVHLFASKLKGIVGEVAGVVIGAVVKFLWLFITVVNVMIPVVLGLPAPKAAIVGAQFSFPQLITALIGGAIAIVIAAVIGKTVKK